MIYGLRICSCPIHRGGDKSPNYKALSVQLRKSYDLIRETESVEKLGFCPLWSMP